MMLTVMGWVPCKEPYVYRYEAGHLVWRPTTRQRTTFPTVEAKMHLGLLKVPATG